jgi:DNA polymerase I-like protein with 3'-5' exonuclease and polymerase domains
MKRAQYRAQTEVFPAVRRAGYEVRPTLQVHDSLKVKYHLGAWDLLNPMMEWAMTADSWMVKCPIVTDSEHGESWGKLHKAPAKCRAKCQEGA